MPSSVVASIDYEAEHARLTVAFTTGRVYEYFLVPPHIAEAFRTAASKGTFFNTSIRDRYTFRELDARRAQMRKRSAR